MSKIFKPRRGSATTMNGSKASTVLAEGELFFEYPSTGVGTGECKIKLGDGSTAYSSLPYAVDGTAISSKAVTVTSNSSSTITAALNNVATGKTLGVIVGALKQAVSLCNTSITALNDEISSLGSSSGGIQWNANSKYIQLLSSDGSTWINWKYYDPTRSFEIVASTGGTKAASLSYTCEYNGYYAALRISGVSIPRIPPSCTGGTQLYAAYTTQSSIHISIYNCTIGNSIYITGANATEELMAVLYIGSGYSGVSKLSESDVIKAGTIGNSISSVNGLLIGMRVAYNNGNTSTAITSESDNYKAVSTTQNYSVSYPCQIDCVLSHQTNTVTLKETTNYSTNNYAVAVVYAFQLS